MRRLIDILHSDRLIELLTGPHRHATIVFSLGLNSIAWALYRVIATYPRDIHFDMSELYSWSRTPAWGYEKHPPLSASVVHWWFLVFPASDWAFTLLAALNIAVALYLAWLILDRWTDSFKAVFGLVLLTFIPFYNFHSLKYNANTVLLPLWAATTYCFLRAYENRDAQWSILAGLTAGGAMLGKYWSFFLVTGLVFASLLDARRADFFKSRAPYLMIASGGLVLAPHLVWLTTHTEPIAYAIGRATDGAPASIPLFNYIAGSIAYAIGPFALWILLLRPSLAALRDTIRPTVYQRILFLYALILPSALPLIATLFSGVKILSLWVLAGYTLLPVVLLSSPLIHVSAEVLKQAVIFGASFPILAVALSPIVMMALHLTAKPKPADYASLLSRDIAEKWQTLSSRPIPTIFSCGPDKTVAMAVGWDLQLPSRVFYGRLGLSARSKLLENGGIIVGAADDPECPEQQGLAGIRPRSEFLVSTYRPYLLGVEGLPFSYFAAIIPPP